jgi:hypothetical protein
MTIVEHPVHLITEANWSYRLARTRQFLGPILIPVRDCLPERFGRLRRLIGGPISTEEICFRKYFGYPSSFAGIDHIKFILEELASLFVRATDKWRTQKIGYEASCRGEINARLDLKLDHAGCKAEIAILFRAAQARRSDLMRAWNASRHFKPGEISEDIQSEKLFPLSKLRDQLILDLKETEIRQS